MRTIPADANAPSGIVPIGQPNRPEEEPKGCLSATTFNLLPKSLGVVAAVTTIAFVISSVSRERDSKRHCERI